MIILLTLSMRYDIAYDFKCRHQEGERGVEATTKVEETIGSHVIPATGPLPRGPTSTNATPIICTSGLLDRYAPAIPRSIGQFLDTLNTVLRLGRTSENSESLRAVLPLGYNT